MSAGVVADRVLDEQLGACFRRLTSDVGVIVIEVRQGAGLNELIENVTCKVELAQSRQCETDDLR